MATIFATFRLIDEMSSRLDCIADSGLEAISQLENTGQAANTTFGIATNAATQTVQSIDNVSYSLDNLQDTATETASFAGQFNDALEEQSRHADETAESIEHLGEQAEQSGQQSEGFGEQSVDAIKGLSNALAAAGIAKALKSIYDGFMQCSEVSAEFETTVAKVTTVADTTKTSIGTISSSILSLSSDTGDAATGLSDAVYQAISAGVDTAKAVEFAGTANELAAGGFTEAATAVDVLTTAINAYGLESADATKISDMLIVTQNLGKTTVNELSSSVGNVIPLAAAYGVEMDNLSTAYAQLTAGGIATAESGTYLKAMLGELGNSSGDVAATLQSETGQSFAMLIEQGYSLGDVLEVLGKSVDGDTTKFNELWSSTEAGIGALSLFNSGSGEFNAVLGKMQNSAGATAKAYAIMSDTTAEAQEGMATAATNLKIAIGNQLNPVLTQLYNAGATAFSWAGDFIEDHPTVVAGIASVVVGITAVVGAITVFTVAQSALTTGTVLHTAAQAALNVVMNLNPALLIATKIITLTAVVATFVAVLATQETEYESWTASTKKQHDELEILNTKYDEACNQYGKTSVEASKLRYEIDDLNIAFESNKKTVEEFVIECEAVAEANSKLISSYQDSVAEIDNTETGTFALIQKLNDLATATDKSAVAEDQMKSIILKLNKDLPELALSYDDVTSSTDATVQALKKAAKAQADQNRFQKNQEAYVELLEQQAINEEKVAQATENIRIEQEKIEKNGIFTADSVWANWTTDIDDYRKCLETAEAAQAESVAQLEAIEQEWAGIKQATEEAANAPISYDEAITNSLDNVKGKMDELIIKYDEAYVAARNSIDATVGLFQKAETEAGLSSQGIIDAWQSQIDFFNQYSDNLKQLEQFGIDPELLQQLSDGSVQSINQVQALAVELGNMDTSGAEAAVDRINNKLGELEIAKNTAASTMIEIKEDFSSQLDAMNEDLVEAINKMSMDTEAKEKAVLTMNGYISGINAQMNAAVSAAEAVANAVSNALSTTASAKINVTSAEPKHGFATGTMDAPPGLALVGEKGPELINFGGGEIVYTADETNKIISGLSNSPNTTAVPKNFDFAQSRQSQSNSTVEKKITLEIAGSGAIGVNSNMSDEKIIDMLYKHIKPVLSNIIKQEIFEEGDLSYDY